MHFNDIRTTLQALIAIYDNCNSLHTNAYDEAVTTPTAESVRRALAIQMIINREWGLAMNENPLQGSFVIDELTDLVEEAVLAEFDRISERGGVLGAMETGYQRGRIQDESMLYEQRKHDGSLPIIGVNTFRPPEAADGTPDTIELARATEDGSGRSSTAFTATSARTARARPRSRRCGGGAGRGERVRGPDGRGPRVQPPADHRRVLRGRRPVQAQRLMSVDDTGHPVPVPGRVRRVVSIVPSLTETVAVTAPDLLAGATDWCTRPEGLDVPRVKGTKNPDVEKIAGLRPDVVLGSTEENRPADIEAMRAAGSPSG